MQDRPNIAFPLQIFVYYANTSRGVTGSMRIGFGIELLDNGQISEDESLLNSLDCEKIFLAESRDKVKIILDDVHQIVRKGDILVLVDLSRLAMELSRVVDIVRSFAEQQVDFVVLQYGISPDNEIGRALGPICSILADVSRSLDAENMNRQGRRRGRPTLMTPEEQARAHRLLVERHASVLEVARLLRVSPTTIYRYFPRRRLQKPTK